MTALFNLLCLRVASSVPHVRRLGYALAALLLACVHTVGHAQADAKRDYVLGSGDVVRISVYQNPDLALETRISETGVISYPLLGSIKLGGLPIAQAEKVIADGLKNGNFLKQPQVSILIVQVRGNQASVLGMVNHPGMFPIEVTGLRLSGLLALAGGITPGGSDTVTLTGTRDGKVFRKQVDIGELLTAGAQTDDPVIQNGDTVYVDRMAMVYIFGEVQKAGSMRLERGMTVMQALANGGGLTQRGTMKGLKVHRRDAKGVVQMIDVAPTDLLRDADVIYVRESLF